LKLIQTPFEGSRPFLERFRNEARALGKLKHPNIVEVTDYGVDPPDEGSPYLVMEYLEGTTLDEMTRKTDGLPIENAMVLLEQVASAIDYAHEQGVLHRDLKPVNVFISDEENGKRSAKILDFGVAKLLPQEESPSPVDEAEETPARPPTMAVDRTDVLPRSDARKIPPSKASGTFDDRRTLTGTPTFMAPEIIKGRGATEASDIYSFGVLTYCTLVGNPPFTGTSLEILRAHIDSDPPKPSVVRDSLPPELDGAILAPLEKDPEERPKHAADVVRGIRLACRDASRRRWHLREVPRRLALSAVLVAAAVPSFLVLKSCAAIRDLELKTVDARFSSVPRRPPDPRIVVISVDEATLQEDPTPLVNKADEVGGELERVFSAGAEGVAIDFLLPEAWSRSSSFSQLVLKHADRLTLAAFSAPSGQTVGTECLGGLTAAALGPGRTLELFGFVNIEEDGDGITRRGRLSFMDQDGVQRASWAARVAGHLNAGHPGTEDFWIDHRIDWQELRRISWKDLPRQLQDDPSTFNGRLALVGGDFVGSGDDYHRIPSRTGSPPAVSGVVLNALMVDTILSDFPFKEQRALYSVLTVSPVLVVMVVGALLLPRLAWVAGLSSVATVLYVATTFFAFRAGHILAPWVSPVLTGVLALGIALLLRRYLPPFPR
jgi:serine/threonine protein kinase